MIYHKFWGRGLCTVLSESFCIFKALVISVLKPFLNFVHCTFLKRTQNQYGDPWLSLLCYMWKYLKRCDDITGLLFVSQENERTKDLIIEQKFHRTIIGQKGEKIREVRDKFPEVLPLITEPNPSSIISWKDFFPPGEVVNVNISV